jgi:nitrile hydratase
MGASGEWNIDMSRSARETLPDYHALTYYERWVKGLETLLIERGLVGRDELSASRMLHPSRPVARVLRAVDVPAVLAHGAPTQRAANTPARFATGERVRMRAQEVAHHTRLPRYVRGKVGCIEHIRGVHVFADTNAQGLGQQPQWLYTIVFDARELWGAAADQNACVSIDAWEPYLESPP